MLRLDNIKIYKDLSEEQVKENFIKVINNTKNNKYQRITKGHINCPTGLNSVKCTLNPNNNSNKINNINTDISNIIKTKSKVNCSTNYNNI